LVDVEGVEQLRSGVGLVLRSDASLKRRPEVAWTGGGDDLESLVRKKPGQRGALVIAARRIVKIKRRRTVAVANILDGAILGGGNLGCRLQVH
jgi:hypothetical protein